MLRFIKNYVMLKYQQLNNESKLQIVARSKIVLQLHG